MNDRFGQLRRFALIALPALLLAGCASEAKVGGLQSDTEKALEAAQNAQRSAEENSAKLKQLQSLVGSISASAKNAEAAAEKAQKAAERAADAFQSSLRK